MSRFYCHDDYEHRRDAERDARRGLPDREYYDPYSPDACKEAYTRAYDAEKRREDQRRRDAEDEAERREDRKRADELRWDEEYLEQRYNEQWREIEE